MIKDFTASGYADCEAVEVVRSTREGLPPICPKCSHPMAANSVWERRIVLRCENQYCTGDKVVFSRQAAPTESSESRRNLFLSK